MATVGSATFELRLAPRRVLDVVDGLEMMVRLLNEHGHAWTDDERATLIAAVEACESRRLDVEPA